MKLVSIVILNWNGKKFLEQFMGKLADFSQVPGAEIVVADNASSDDSISYLEKYFPGIRIIRLDKNYGFSGGYNRALEQIRSRYFLLINSDMEVTRGWLEPMLEFMEKNPDVAACSPKILDYNRRKHFEYAGAAGGYIDKFGYAFCRGRIFDVLEEDNQQYDQTVETFWATGACFMVRAQVFQELKGFDEYFFAHMEEIDLCWRMKNIGYKICCVPASAVYHVGGGTLATGNPFKTYLNFRNNLLLLYKNLPRNKFYSTMFARLVLDAVSALRYLLRGDLKDFAAVVKAHISFHIRKKSYRCFRKTNKMTINSVNFTEIYSGSIVIDFFFLKNKTFSRLRHRFYHRLNRIG
ncbi:MAG TPA: glycosyltransferase family 2 protein [Bacteroidaceae bacterium]|nr:glycosyltransferase family 2 protein [Bacteroidaceae bacterium]